jgi:hypothetical protein
MGVACCESAKSEGENSAKVRLVHGEKLGDVPRIGNERQELRNPGKRRYLLEISARAYTGKTAHVGQPLAFR